MELSTVVEMRAEPSPVVCVRDHELIRVPQRILCEEAWNFYYKFFDSWFLWRFIASIVCLIVLNENDFEAHIKWLVMFSWAKLKAS